MLYLTALSHDGASPLPRLFSFEYSQAFTFRLSVIAVAMVNAPMVCVFDSPLLVRILLNRKTGMDAYALLVPSTAVVEVHHQWILCIPP